MKNTIRRPLPTREQRDHLLNVVFADDPRPPRCPDPDHTDPKRRGADCDACLAINRWLRRIGSRFHELNLRLSFNDHDYDDPQPPRCPRRHAFTPPNIVSCGHCKTIYNWKERRRKKIRQQFGTVGFTDWDTLTRHVQALADAGMTPQQIAEAAHCGRLTVRRIQRGADGRRYVRAEIARRILAVPIPERRLRLVPGVGGIALPRVDATGTRRRINCARRAGHSLQDQAARLGWSARTLRDWLNRDTVTVEAATAVADMFPTWISRPGKNKVTASIAANGGHPEARHFSATNIDDPAYDPFAVINSPTAVRRQLRALAWMGQGPEQVGEFIGESAEQVEIWLKGGPALAYVPHLVDVAFEALSGTFGPDNRAARRARRARWAPPLAWYGIDMADENAKPCIGLPPKARKTDYPLDSQVLLALIGRVKAAELLKPEKIRVVWILHRAGWSDRRIAAWLRWNQDGDLDAGRAAVGAFRYREHIVGFGLADDALCNREAEDGLIVTPSAA